MVLMFWFASTLRASWRTQHTAEVSPSFRDYSTLSKVGQFGEWRVAQAIEPHLSLQQTLYSWNQIAQALAEKSRNRLLQLVKWHAS
jgi:hypothetical protein